MSWPGSGFDPLRWLPGPRAAARARRAEAKYPPTGRFVTVGGGRVHAHVEGTGPDVVLIHGANGNTRDWSFDVIPRLAGRYRLIAMDRPGMGYSDRVTRGFVDSPAQQAAGCAPRPPRWGRKSRSSSAIPMAGRSRWPGRSTIPTRCRRWCFSARRRTPGAAVSAGFMR
jgi:pimeloyl-ACP methyl ester carboxylesterase